MISEDITAIFCSVLLDNGDNSAGTDRAAALADSEAQTSLDGDRRDQGDFHLDVVAGHYHLNAVRQFDVAGNVSRAEVELRTT